MVEAHLYTTSYYNNTQLCHVTTIELNATNAEWLWIEDQHNIPLSTTPLSFNLGHLHIRYSKIFFGDINRDHSDSKLFI